MPGPEHCRIAVGLLWQETNAFNPVATRAADFIVHEGDAVLAAYAGSGTSLGGMINTLRESGVALCPVLSAKARPGGAIDGAAIEALIDRMVSGIVACRPSGVCLELHGAMCSDKLDDVEGALLEALRAALGPDIPIVAALDLHGHVTPAMVGAATLLTGYRTQPHADMVETGQRAAQLLLSVINADTMPAAARACTPFLALSNDETDQPPLRAVYEHLSRLRHDCGARLIDASIFNVHPFLDVPGQGQVVLAYAKDATLARRVASQIADDLWDRRADFTDQAENLDAIVRHLEHTKPNDSALVIGDQGDSVLAGTPGDSLAIARHISQHRPLARGLAPVWDPAAVAHAWSAGVGASVVLTLGASLTPGLEPWTVAATVERLTDGSFKNTGAYMTGLTNEHGRSALLRVGCLRVLVTSNAPAACDPALLSEAGLTAAEIDYLVVKSSNHFKLSFASSFRCAVAASPGLSARSVAQLRHQRARPIYPLDAVDRDATKLNSFSETL